LPHDHRRDLPICLAQDAGKPAQQIGRSFDLEAHPEHPFKTVDDCLRHVLKQLEGTDIRVSFRNYSPDLRNKYMDMGVTVFMERPRA
jgi:hypothetical protein